MAYLPRHVNAPPPEPVSPKEDDTKLQFVYVGEHNTTERIDYKNPEGYADSTPYNALRNLQRDNADINAMRLIKCILTLLDLNGYTLIGRLNIRDRLTGREYK